MAIRIRGKEVTEAQIVEATDLTDDEIRAKVSKVIPQPSDYQMAIFRFFLVELAKYMRQQPNVINLVVRATAGSGKTTTIVAIAELIPHYMSAIFLAFNKPIADELDKKLPEHVWGKTLNSAGWNICKRYADAQAGRKIAFKDFTNPNKLNKLIREMKGWDFYKEFGADVRWLVGMAQNLGIVPTGANNAVAPNGLDDSDASFDMICSHYDRRIPVYSKAIVYQTVREVLIATLGIVTEISFDEQKYFAVVLRDGGRKLSWYKFDLVIIDEVQDVNAIDMELVDMLRKKNGLVCGVGDPRQSIYGFRGADTQAFEKFKERFNCHELPLTVTFRCARKIVELAQTIYPEIEVAPGAAEGNIETLDEYTPAIFQPEGDDLVVCRNNAPIVAFAYKLIAARVPVFVKGRDIGRGLISLIDKMGSDSVRQLALDLELWRTQQISIALDNNPDDEAAIQSIGDKFDSIMVFVRSNVDDSVATLKKEIEDLFSVRTKETDDERLMSGKVVLSTIHKAKGLEAERVFFMDRFLLFPRWIEEGTWQEEQETNLLFVAATRPKNDLIFIESKKLK